MGGSAVSNLDGVPQGVNTAIAFGGAGGSGTNGSAGANGGAAAASSILIYAPTQSHSTADATGGAGGAAESNANGGHGGKATASASGRDAYQANVPSNQFYVEASAIGGAGGAGDGVGNRGGAGGAAAASGDGLDYGAGTISVTAIQTGGAGGEGLDGADGGAGAASTMANAVVGSTNVGGSLVLNQTATGGAGGASSGGVAGQGGAAISKLTFDDTKTQTQSASITGEIVANGGAGGSGGAGAAGGAATATSILTGIHAVNSQVYATGGAGGSSAAGGAAHATSSATGLTADSAATAIAGSGDATAALASATAVGHGQTGGYQANATSNPGSGAVYDLTASAGGSLDGTATTFSSGRAFAQTSFATATPVFPTNDQAVAEVVGAPTTSDVNTVLDANPNIKSAFGSSPSYFAIGQLGGSYDLNGVGSETVDDTLSMTIDPTKLSNPQDLIVGLYDGTGVGSGVSSLTFEVSAEGKTLVDQTFTSVAAADTYFSDHPLDLGAIDSINSGQAFDLQISLSETLTNASSGYDASLIVGDPPPAATSSIAGNDAHHAALAAALFDGAFGNAGTDAAQNWAYHGGQNIPDLVADANKAHHQVKPG